MKKLLTSGNIRDITLEDIYAITDTYKVNIHRRFKRELLELYARYLRDSLKDNKLSKDEIDDLNHLKYLFDLRERDVKALHEDITGKIYLNHIQEVIEDGKLDEDERHQLEALRQNLKLEDQLAEKLYRESATELVYDFIYDAISDERLSPDEEKQLENIIKNLQADIKIDLGTRKLLDKYKLFWQVENSELPVIHTGIYLHRKEKCHFMCTVKWLEPKRKLAPGTMGNTKILVKIRKGLYWRKQAPASYTFNSALLKTHDIGELLITNKRLIFLGMNENLSVRLNQILDFDIFRNGIEIQRDNGSGFFFECTKDTDIFGIILGRAIEDAL